MTRVSCDEDEDRKRVNIGVEVLDRVQTKLLGPHTLLEMVKSPVCLNVMIA